MLRQFDVVATRQASAISVPAQSAHPGCQREIILPGQRRDPEVIIRNWLAKARQIGFEIAIVFGCTLVRQQQCNRPEKRADSSESLLRANRSLCAETEFAQHDPWDLDAGSLSKASG